MWSVELTVGNESALAVHRFDVVEGVSSLFAIDVVVRTRDAALDLLPLIGAEARLTVAFERPAQRRTWTGIAVRAEQARAVTAGFGEELSEYHFRVVPRLWLSTQRINHRVFQHVTVPEIVEQVLGQYGTLEWKVDRAAHPKLEIRVQYGESDFAFASRLLEETGISYALVEEDESPRLVLADAPTSTPARRHPALSFDMTPSIQMHEPRVRDVRAVASHRPGSRVVTDYDFRNPALMIHASHRAERPGNGEQEVHEYRPGGALIERDPGAQITTPVADDRGFARVDTAFANDRSQRALEAARAGRIEVVFESNQVDLAAGSVFKIEQHPHPLVADELLVVRTAVHGVVPDTMRVEHTAVSAAEGYRPPVTTPRPVVTGVQSATVTGPRGEEIHVDEYGRVRLLFPWDRDGTSDDRSFCWTRVADGWAGTSFGMISLPRVGQEVLVAFLAGDPDQPVVVGRMYNETHPVPYKLPDDKTVSGWKTSSSPASGGYSELKLEDKRGRELVYTRAQRDRHALVRRDRRTRIERKHHMTTVADEHHVVKQVRRELVQQDSHLHVVGDRREKFDARLHTTVGVAADMKVGSKWAVEAGNEIHIKAGSHLVIEAGARLTLKGPGGFIDIHAGGVDVVGEMVRINSGGSAGSGSGAAPVPPEEAEEAEPMDVSVD